MTIKSRKTHKATEDEFISENLETKIEEQPSTNDLKKLNINAPRTYKSYTLQLNEYEYRLLEKLSQQDERSMSNILRIALKNLAAEKNLI